MADKIKFYGIRISPDEVKEMGGSTFTKLRKRRNYSRVESWTDDPVSLAKEFKTQLGEYGFEVIITKKSKNIFIGCPVERMGEPGQALRLKGLLRRFKLKHELGFHDITSSAEI